MLDMSLALFAAYMVGRTFRLRSAGLSVLGLRSGAIMGLALGLASRGRRDCQRSNAGGED